jgi:hypothetical protein
MSVFVLNLICDQDTKPFRAPCSILGEGTGFDGSMRRFEDELDMIKALNGAGIQAERYAVALRMVLSGEQGSFELTQNEAQKLGVLHTDTSE